MRKQAVRYRQPFNELIDRKKAGMCLAAAGTAICGIAPAASGAEAPEKEHLYVSEQLVYDDNLFRVADTPGTGTTSAFREDYANRITAGMAEEIHLGRQTLLIKGRAQDVRYERNDYLDHTAGDAATVFDWRLLGDWSGKVSADYSRVLADFANSFNTSKDLVETIGYNASLRYQLGPRWSISANGRRMRTEHDLDERRVEDLEADIGRVSLDYVTPSEHALGFEYRYVDAQFPNAVLDSLGRNSSDYTESGAFARFTYTATVHTQLRASAGYVERKRPDREDGDYSGDVWRAEIDWHPRQKFSMVLAGWRELRAYVDAESDYFVSDGASLAPTWSPLQTLSLSVTLSYEEQDYIASRLLLTPEETTPRADEMAAALTTFTYRPRPNLQFELSYRAADRDSNRAVRRYDAQTAGVSIRWGVM